MRDRLGQTRLRIGFNFSFKFFFTIGFIFILRAEQESSF